LLTQFISLGQPLSCKFKVGPLSWLSSICPSITDVLWLNGARYGLGC